MNKHEKVVANAMNEYEAQAEKFLADTGTTMSIKYLGNYPSTWDTDGTTRDQYRVTFRRGSIRMADDFGQSIVRSKSPNVQQPTAYDVLACLTKSDPGTHANFCAEYGYDEDSRKGYATYEAVVAEWYNVERVFGDVLEQLREIS